LPQGQHCGVSAYRLGFEQSEHTVPWHQGTLYPVLHRLEKRGLLTSEWVAPPTQGQKSLRRGAGKKTGRQRRYYRLTARGQRLWREQRDHWRAFSRGVNALLGL
jgi:DNA-binding PadR family transcriptional regulator